MQSDRIQSGMQVGLLAGLFVGSSVALVARRHLQGAACWRAALTSGALGALSFGVGAYSWTKVRAVDVRAATLMPFSLAKASRSAPSSDASSELSSASQPPSSVGAGTEPDAHSPVAFRLPGPKLSPCPLSALECAKEGSLHLLGSAILEPAKEARVVAGPRGVYLLSQGREGVEQLAHLVGQGAVDLAVHVLQGTWDGRVAAVQGLGCARELACFSDEDELLICNLADETAVRFDLPGHLRRCQTRTIYRSPGKAYWVVARTPSLDGNTFHVAKLSLDGAESQSVTFQTERHRVRPDLPKQPYRIEEAVLCFGSERASQGCAAKAYLVGRAENGKRYSLTLGPELAIQVALGGGHWDRGLAVTEFFARPYDAPTGFLTLLHLGGASQAGEPAIEAQASVAANVWGPYRYVSAIEGSAAPWLEQTSAPMIAAWSEKGQIALIQTGRLPVWVTKLETGLPLNQNSVIRSVEKGRILVIKTDERVYFVDGESGEALSSHPLKVDAWDFVETRWALVEIHRQGAKVSAYAVGASE